MAMSIRLSEPRLLPDLIAHFLRNDCVAQRLDDVTCSVVHVQAHDAEEAFLEVLFFLRAWQDRHLPVSTFLSV